MFEWYGKSCDMNLDCMKCDKANCTIRKYDYDKMAKEDNAPAFVKELVRPINGQA